MREPLTLGKEREREREGERERERERKRSEREMKLRRRRPDAKPHFSTREPDGTFKLTGVANLQKKDCDVYAVFYLIVSYMFHYVLKAKFVTLVSLKVPSGRKRERDGGKKVGAALNGKTNLLHNPF